MKFKNRFIRRRRGFALIVTLSLMILLTVIAVGLLSLSSIALRTTGEGDAMSKARANARLALMLAIGDLQKAAGPDKAITAPANLLNASAPAGITGVWKSHRESYSSTDYTTSKTGDNFLGYLMSNPNPENTQDPQTLPGVTGKSQELVGSKSVGANNGNAQISAPMITVDSPKPGLAGGGISWLTMDEGVKGRIDLLPSADPSGQGEYITQAGAPARNGFEGVKQMDFLNAEKSSLLEILPKVVSLNQANLGAKALDAAQKYFHDFTVSSNSLQVDVANGGLKTDLSVLFEGNYGQANLPSDYSSRFLYSDTNTPFQGSSTNSDVQWSLYANYARLYRKTTGNDNPKNGLKATLPLNYSLKSLSDATIRKNRYEPAMAALKQPMLMPTVARIDTVFSIVARDNHHPLAGYPYLLHLMYLPVVTLHNPYNVPLRCTNLQVEFSDIPIGFEFLINGLPTTTGGLLTMNQFYIDQDNASNPPEKKFTMLLSNSLGGGTEVVMGPGETRIFGTPFSPDTNWSAELGTNGTGKGLMFDYKSNQTGSQGATLTIPGMITSSKIGMGFDVDWLVPKVAGRSPWLVARKDDGVLYLNSTDKIQVRYGPKIPVSATNKSFTITLRMPAANGTVTDYAKTQVFYESDTKLKTIVEEGTSDRFPDKRTFPDTCPRGSEAPITAAQIYEPNGNALKKYALARPFAIFSVSEKTSKESFTMSRPVTDTGVAFQMATCDFTGGKSSGGTSPLEFTLVPVKQGGVVIESGGVLDAKKTSLQGYLFGGHGQTNGSTNATIYEIPMAPLQSIAQLRHANGSSIGSAPYVTYSVGESRAHPAIPSEAAFVKVDSSRTALDHSWLANDQLWDKYWFSTLATLQGVAYSGTAAATQESLSTDFFAGIKKLPNPRNVPYIPAGVSAADAANAARTMTTTAPYTHSAAYMLTRGGFNVNSTSIPAWISILSGLASCDVPLVPATGGSFAFDKDPVGTPFLRVRQPTTGNAIASNGKYWNGYRTLSADQIATLAKEIVTEVKARGPFLSMAEFVNRRLGGKTDVMTQKGALQAALDRSKINLDMNNNARDISPVSVSTYGWQNPDVVDMTTGAGAPGEISQGDVLSSIGSFVSVRSDTFRIRTYGETRNAAGAVIARAWCEATVQRVTEYLDGADAPEAVATAPTNVTFGRQFKIVDFRWLSKDEI